MFSYVLIALAITLNFVLVRYGLLRAFVPYMCSLLCFRFAFRIAIALTVVLKFVVFAYRVCAFVLLMVLVRMAGRVEFPVPTFRFGV